MATTVAAPGFGPLDISDVTVNGAKVSKHFNSAITGVIVQRNLRGASTLTIQLTDPQRKLLNMPDLFSNGSVVEIPDGFGNYLQFAFVQLNKASDQIQIQFESRSVYDLRQLRNVLPSSDVTDAASFVQNLCSQKNIPFVGPAGNDAVFPKTFAAATGSTLNPDEDAWASIQRMAGTLGWRCWESAGTVFFGPDDYWFNKLYAFALPPVNAYYNHPVATLKEFTQEVQLIDVDWDIGSPFGDATITCMSHLWQYNPGEIVVLADLGPASGPWIVSAMQRNFFNPQATVTLTVPMPAGLVLTPPTLPIVGGRYAF
jgi:hypothetical protein